MMYGSINERTYKILSNGLYALAMTSMFGMGYWMGYSLNLKKECKTQVVNALLDACEQKH